MIPEHDAAPAVSDEARRLINEALVASFRSGQDNQFCCFEMEPQDKDCIAAEAAAHEVLLAYVAGLEARNAELFRQREEAWGAWQAECDRHAETCSELSDLECTAALAAQEKPHA